MHREKYGNSITEVQLDVLLITADVSAGYSSTPAEGERECDEEERTRKQTGEANLRV